MFNANNYGYNSYIPQRPMQQVQPMESTQFIANKPVVAVKQVDSIDVVKASEIPFNFDVNYFSLADGSAIFTKQYQQDGTCKIVTYKPVFNEDKPQNKFVTIDEIDNLKEQIKKLEDRISELQETKKSKKKEEIKDE